MGAFAGASADVGMRSHPHPVGGEQVVNEAGRLAVAEAELAVRDGHPAHAASDRHVDEPTPLVAVAIVRRKCACSQAGRNVWPNSRLLALCSVISRTRGIRSCAFSFGRPVDSAA